jgi:Spy/CpxP family protein refolding chaperone
MRTLVPSLLVLGSVALSTAPQAVARADDPSSDPAPQLVRPPARLPRVKSPNPSTPRPTTAKETATSDADDIVQIVDEALSNIALSSEQTAALTALGAAVDAKVGAVDRARDVFVLALADQIDEGKVRADMLTPEIQKVIDAGAEASAELRHGLKKLHDTLSPEQRLQFVAGFREALDKRASLVDPKSQIEAWSKALDLTDAQKQKVEAVVGEDKVDDDVEKARAEVVLAAFPGKTFSMDDLLPAGAIRDRAEQMLQDIAAAADKVTAFLTPDQRSTAAAIVREKMFPTTKGESRPRPPPPSLETPASVSEPLWVGRGGYYGAAYRRPGAFGFNRTYATGFGGMYLL